MRMMSQVPLDPGIEVVSPEEAEKASFVVCVFAGQESKKFKADNVYTDCAECGSPITHRPHAPKTPPKICIRCAIEKIREEVAENTAN